MRLFRRRPRCPECSRRVLEVGTHTGGVPFYVHERYTAYGNEHSSGCTPGYPLLPRPGERGVLFQHKIPRERLEAWAEAVDYEWRKTA